MDCVGDGGGVGEAEGEAEAGGFVVSKVLGLVL